MTRNAFSYKSVCRFGCQCLSRIFGRQEEDDEVKGEGNSYTTFYRQLDADWLLISSIQNSLNKQLKKKDKFLGKSSEFPAYSGTNNSRKEVKYRMEKLLGFT